MVWNKTPQSKVNSIVQALRNYEKTYKDIANEFEVSEWLVWSTAKKNLSQEVLRERYSFFCRKTKLGNKNHMHGKVGFLHHNSTTDIVRVSGYKTVFAPVWWKGKTVKSGRMYEHHYVWALDKGYAFFPKGYVIHHIDLNIDNNSIDNLELMTISNHIKLHWEIRKVQRLDRKIVGNSVPEAQNNQ